MEKLIYSIPVIFLASPRRPSIAAPPPKVEGESCSPSARQDEEEERSVGRGGEVDEQGVEGRRQAPGPCATPEYAE